MTLPSAVEDRERLKFKDVSGETAVRVTIAEDTSGIESIPPSDLIDNYSEISSLVKDVETLILIYTVPIGKTFYLDRVQVSGENIADYRIYVDASKIARGYTYFGASLSHDFVFSKSQSVGKYIAASSVLEVKVIHSRPTSADFNARIVGILK